MRSSSVNEVRSVGKRDGKASGLVSMAAASDLDRATFRSCYCRQGHLLAITPGSHAPRGNGLRTLRVEETWPLRRVGGGPATQSVEDRGSHAERGNQEALISLLLLFLQCLSLPCDRVSPSHALSERYSHATLVLRVSVQRPAAAGSGEVGGCFQT